MNWCERTFRHLGESLAWNEGCFKAFVKMLAGSIANLSKVIGVYGDHHPAYR
jgi:phosphoglycerol transferase MdoB-like AlkP superfamily enzyme